MSESDNYYTRCSRDKLGVREIHKLLSRNNAPVMNDDKVVQRVTFAECPWCFIGEHDYPHDTRSTTDSKEPQTETGAPNLVE